MTHLQNTAKAALHEEFPRWDLSMSGIHHYWAMRNDQPTTAEIKAGAKLFIDGDTLRQLRERLRAQENLLAGVER